MLWQIPPLEQQLFNPAHDTSDEGANAQNGKFNQHEIYQIHERIVAWQP